MTGSITMEAPAKLNLGLEVVGRREDGYHEIATVFQTIDLVDDLVLEPAPELELQVSGLVVPGGEENLVMQAARLLAARAGNGRGARISLHKRIRAGAGLGGGSSDAAAALLGLNRLWGIGLSYRDLRELASELGADVPFFLVAGTALGLGRGDAVIPLPQLPALAVALVSPEEGLSTQEVFQSGNFSLTNICKYNIITRFAHHYLTGQGLDQLVRNDLQPAATELLPRIGFLCEGLREAGALATSMTGSGSSVYGLFQEESEARRALERCGDGVETAVLRFLPRRGTKGGTEAAGGPWQTGEGVEAHGDHPGSSLSGGGGEAEGVRLYHL